MMNRRRVITLICLSYGLAIGAEQIDPIVEKVSNNCDGTYTAVFGYKNPNAKEVKLPRGKDNRFVDSDSENVGQPASFKPGLQKSALTMKFRGDKATWMLNGRAATALADSADCSCMNDVPAEVEALAKKDYRRVFALASGADTSKITLGQPYRVFLSTGQLRDARQTGEPIERTVYAGVSQWLYPLWYNGEVICYLRFCKIKGLGNENGNWRYRDAGCTDKTQPSPFGDLARKWPYEEGYHVFLVQALDIQNTDEEFYFSVPEAGRRNLTKLSLARNSTAPQTAKSQSDKAKRFESLKSLDETVESLRSK
jgi:hypothetical protein